MVRGDARDPTRYHRGVTKSHRRGGAGHFKSENGSGAMRDEADTVIAVVERNRLSGLLTAVHRAGHGPHARVLDPARGSLAGQLERAGVKGQAGVVAEVTQAVVVLIHAPGRTAAVADLLQRAGAKEVVPVRRGVPAASSPYAPPAWTGRFELPNRGDGRQD